MRRFAPTILIALAATAIVPAHTAGAGTPHNPDLSDPAGDANFVDGTLPGSTPSSPASLGHADITKVWISTDHSVESTVRDGARGRLSSQVMVVSK